MNINPAAAASIAGTSRAAAKGGQNDAASADATDKVSAAEKPGGKSEQDAGVDAGQQTDDRGGDGHQMLDVFEKRGEDEDQPDAAQDSKPDDSIEPDRDGHLDFQA